MLDKMQNIIFKELKQKEYKVIENLRAIIKLELNKDDALMAFNIDSNIVYYKGYFGEYPVELVNTETKFLYE